MIKRVTRTEIKKILKERDSIDIRIGEFKYGVCYGGYYMATISSMEQLEEKFNYAINHGWKKSSQFMIKVEN